jgi:hypothetical protein
MPLSEWDMHMHCPFLTSYTHNVCISSPVLFIPTTRRLCFFFHSSPFFHAGGSPFHPSPPSLSILSFLTPYVVGGICPRLSLTRSPSDADAALTIHTLESGRERERCISRLMILPSFFPCQPNPADIFFPSLRYVCHVPSPLLLTTYHV